jgi:hypothetical protein
MNDVGNCTHSEAMGMIRAANTVTILNYEEAIAIYLRARGILNDGQNMLGDLIPLDWKPKEQLRRLQETVDRKQAAKLLLQKEVTELRAEVEKWKELAALHEELREGCIRQNAELRQEKEEWKKVAREQDCAIRDMRESCAKLVEHTIVEMRLGDNQWARAGLLFAARAVRRGRHLTASEKLENFKNAMAEADEGDCNNAD